MALKKCKECDNMVSNQAKTCPHCGARVRKSFGIEIFFTFIVIACVVILTIKEVPHTIFAENNEPEFEKDLKTFVEENVSEVLNEEYGITCISTNLLEGADGRFDGTAKLEDGREIDIEDARIDGEMIRFKHIVKQGYEYKCKHHIDHLRLIISPKDREQRILSGVLWNDGIEPIRGFVVAEFIDDRGNINWRSRITIPFPPNGNKIFDWVPPGKKAEFKYPVTSDVLTKGAVYMRIEFFNLGNEPLASVRYDMFDESVLGSIPVKVTAQVHEILKFQANSEEWKKIQKEFDDYNLARALMNIFDLP